jgi:hypothetical protein
MILNGRGKGYEKRGKYRWGRDVKVKNAAVRKTRRTAGKATVTDGGKLFVDSLPVESYHWGYKKTVTPSDRLSGNG